MTYPRHQLVPPGSPGVYHCVSRCVRRAFLCGEDRYSGQSFEHRRQWVEDRLHQLTEVFAVSLWAYAVMSNHLHVVVQVLPDTAAQWADEEVARRWIRLFPKADQDADVRAQALLANPERLAVLRSRLSDLSWFMRCLSEPIARRANAEDHCKGRFWEGRFKSQALLDEAAVLAAMTYVDLNPVRAALCETIEDSAHISARLRLERGDAEPASGEVIQPIAGVRGRRSQDTQTSEFSYTATRRSLTDPSRHARHAVVMTYPRHQLVPPGSPGVYHCVSRCVRRAFLCGEDRYSGQSFEHRRQWVEDRLHQLTEVFAVSLWAYAVMSNHLHVVVQVLPDTAAQWTDEEVAQRWIRLFPKADQDADARAQALLANPERLAVLRSRLSDLSWFMRCLSEPIARRANAEDHCKGRFWEGRFKCQALLDEAAVLAAMTYVDLNPVRAALSETIEDSAHTSARLRLEQGDAEPDPGEVIQPIAGVRGLCVVGMTATEYLHVLDWTGRQVHPDKRGTLVGPPPGALRRTAPDASTWPRQVLAVGSDFHRAVGAAESLIAKAAAMGQRWLQGVGVARRLLKATS